MKIFQLKTNKTEKRAKNKEETAMEMVQHARRRRIRKFIVCILQNVCTIKLNLMLLHVGEKG